MHISTETQFISAVFTWDLSKLLLVSNSLGLALAVRDWLHGRGLDGASVASTLPCTSSPISPEWATSTNGLAFTSACLAVSQFVSALAVTATTPIKRYCLPKVLRFHTLLYIRLTKFTTENQSPHQQSVASIQIVSSVTNLVNYWLSMALRHICGYSSGHISATLYTYIYIHVLLRILNITGIHRQILPVYTVNFSLIL